MNVQDIKDLMAQFDASSLMEMSLKNEEVDVTFSKRENHAQALAIQPLETTAVSTPMHQEATNPSEVTSIDTTPTPSNNVEYVVSPIVGIVYMAPSPEDEPYVQNGDRVTKGQTVCIVEAMKLMNEIQSEYAGEIVEILVQNGQMVDFNQPLFAVSKS